MRRILAILALIAAAGIMAVAGPASSSTSWEPTPDSEWLMRTKVAQKCVGLNNTSSDDDFTNRWGNGTDLHQWNCNWGDTQRWVFDDTGHDGEYVIRNVYSNEISDREMCVGPVGGANAAEYAQVHQWQCNGADSQRWTLKGDRGRYWIYNVAQPDMCLVISRDPATTSYDPSIVHADGTKLRLRNCIESAVETISLWVPPGVLH